MDGLAVIRLSWDTAPFYYQYLIKKPSFDARYRELFASTHTKLEEYINDVNALNPEYTPVLDTYGVSTLSLSMLPGESLFGSYVGYNKLFRLHKNSRLGTIAAGYADGIPLSLSNRGYVLVNGAFCPIVGRISMDYTTILLDNAPAAKVGDEVVFFGRQQNTELSIRQWAEAKTTHLHDILCAIGPRVKRVYKNQEQ